MSSRRRGTGGPPQGGTGSAHDPPLRIEKAIRSTLHLPAFPAPGEVGPPPADREEFGLGPSGDLRGRFPVREGTYPPQEDLERPWLPPPLRKKLRRDLEQVVRVPHAFPILNDPPETPVHGGGGKDGHPPRTVQVQAMSRSTYRCSAPPNRFRLRHADFPTVTRTPASRVKKVRRRSASPRSMARARNAGEEWKEGRITGRR